MAGLLLTELWGRLRGRRAGIIGVLVALLVGGGLYYGADEFVAKLSKQDYKQALDYELIAPVSSSDGRCNLTSTQVKLICKALRPWKYDSVGINIYEYGHRLTVCPGSRIDISSPDD